jgi:hypothetical protein
MSVGRREWARASDAGVGLGEVEVARGFGGAEGSEERERKGR